jgi:hypothetical protein
LVVNVKEDLLEKCGKGKLNQVKICYQTSFLITVFHCFNKGRKKNMFRPSKRWVVELWSDEPIFSGTEAVMGGYSVVCAFVWS